LPKTTQVILRTLRWVDLDNLLDPINSLIEEGANIPKTKNFEREGD